ncbi:hypothetical protein D3C75_742940 [compost metagenome]
MHAELFRRIRLDLKRGGLLAQTVQHLLPGVFAERFRLWRCGGLVLLFRRLAELGDLRVAVLHTAGCGCGDLLIDFSETLGELVSLRRRFVQGFVEL